MKTSIQQIHCKVENNPAWQANPLPWEEAGPDPGYATDWEPLLKQYHKGDNRFFQLLCYRSKPLVENISRKQYFVNALGRDEAYSIAAMSMVTFWKQVDLKGNLRDIPGQLFHSMECDLQNQIDRQKTRHRREVHYETGRNTEETANECPEPPADSRDEPEEQVLRAEWNRKVRDCLQYLGKKERQVIHGFFFRQLTVAEIAKEMNCSPNNVKAAKWVALKKLRHIFEEKEIV